MNPFIRSLNELKVITESRAQKNKVIESELSNKNSLEIRKSDKIVNSKKTIDIKLPNLPKLERPRWRKKKEAVLKFFDELDYRNQIQSSYDLTLIENQKNHDHQDVA